MFQKGKKNKFSKFFEMVKLNTCIFISGKGSNLKNLIKKSRDYTSINIKFISNNNSKAKGILYAKLNSNYIYYCECRL